MKVVTIPSCANPFEVCVNGKKYTYPAGDTVVVPDEVAVIIEAHNKKHEPVEHNHEAPFGSDFATKDYVDEKLGVIESGSY